MKLFSKITGHGPPLLILHGLFGSHENWGTVASLLSTHQQIHALDLRNHGRSPQSAEMSYPLMAADVVDYLDDHNLPVANVLGHSMGGKVAMQVALAYADRVSKLVVADIAPKTYPPRHREILDALLSLDLHSLQTRSQMEQALAARIPELAVRQFLLKNVKRNERGGFFWQINLRGIQTNYSLLNAAIKPTSNFEGPTLLITGQKSDYVQPADAEDARRIFPVLQVHSIPGVGHWLHAEAPREFSKTVSEFLGSHGGDR